MPSRPWAWRTQLPKNSFKFTNSLCGQRRSWQTTDAVPSWIPWGVFLSFSHVSWCALGHNCTCLEVYKVHFVFCSFGIPGDISWRLLVTTTGWLLSIWGNNVSNSNWTEWSTIQGAITQVISKSEEHKALGRFEITSMITPCIVLPEAQLSCSVTQANREPKSTLSHKPTSSQPRVK